MKSVAVLRFVVMLVLFTAWLGWLGYLAIATHKPIVVSRPQLLVSNLDIVGRVENADDGKVKVEEVHWPAAEKKLEGQTLTIANPSECLGWRGPGSYILLLSKHEKEWLVTPTPRSPGYPGGKPHIYPATPETLQQIKAFRKPEG
jgi:hypothetical protein